MIYTIIYVLFAIILIPLALKSVSEKNLLHSVIYLFVFLVVLSGLFIFLGASIVGAVEVLVFVGEVTALTVFTLMLTGGKEYE